MVIDEDQDEVYYCNRYYSVDDYNLFVDMMMRNLLDLIENIELQLFIESNEL
jgi:hypothetical protein